MDLEYLPEFGGAFLEDSYFMGMTCKRRLAPTFPQLM